MYWQERMPSWVAGARTATWSRTIRLFRLGSQLANEAGGRRQERERSRTGADDNPCAGRGTSDRGVFATRALSEGVASAPGALRQLLECPQLQHRRVRGRQQLVGLGDERRDLRRGERRTDPIPPSEVAAQPAQQVPGGRLLHALGDDLQPHAVAELDGRSDDGDRAAAGLGNERTVD